MATVTLSVADVNSLPSVCMKCGHAATCVKARRFSVRYDQGRSGNVRYYLERSITVPVPLCDAHRHHWLWRYLLMVLSLPLFCFLVAGMNVVLRGNANPGAVCCPGVAGWGIVALFLYFGMIRATDIGERSVTLAGVAPGFIEAVEQQREENERMRRAFLGDEPRRSPTREGRPVPASLFGLIDERRDRIGLAPAGPDVQFRPLLLEQARQLL
jgi:hypothetical protein